MDHLPVYYESPDTMYHILEDNDSGMGTEELPFAAYSGTLYESESPTLLSNRSLQMMSISATDNHDTDGLDDEDGDDEEENDLEYVDDEQDDDYRPNKSLVSKKGKGKLRKSRHLKTIEVSAMFTPPKKTEAKSDNLSGTRHYAHKDRTPRTIMKMMEKHRESERVRHHTLNESMKNICSRIPGYDPHAKETKVIQMQRIIGYECFLENTINNLCENMGIKRKSFGINTNFITEAMKDKKPEDWFKITPIEVPVTEDEDSLLDNSSMDSSNIKYVRKSSAPRHYTKYRREKISSPTVDSTTDNIIQLYPGRASTTSQPSEGSQDGSWVSQGFRPIQESQESGIKTETPSAVGDAVFHDTIECLFEQELCSEPENLKTVTATFMKDDIVPSSTSIDDDVSEFNLSSPIRYNTNKVFLHSPKPSGIWHQPISLYYPDTSEILGSSEMTSVSPEFILETKPKVQSAGSNNNSRAENYTIRDCCLADLQMVPCTPPKFESSECLEDAIRFTQSCCCETASIPTSQTGSKNKRKRYTPMRAPFKNISNTENNEEVYFDSEKCTQKVVKVLKHSGGGTVKDYARPPVIVISSKDENNNSIVSQRNLAGTSAQRRSPSVLNLTPSIDHPLVMDQPLAVDHRRSTWMNGFMMFSRLNRSRFLRSYPGLQSSHIQRIMGEAWRNMSEEAQQPYREKARKYSQYIKETENQGLIAGTSDRLVPSSTTDDLEFIISGL